MKTRYFVNDSYKLDDNVVGRELYLKHGAYYFKDGIVSNCITFCGENQEYEIHITKVEEMELSDFIADGRTKCGQCGKVEVQDAGLCSDCISKLPTIDSRKVVDIHQNENGSFSVGSVVNMCEHDEIVYTSSQYVEAIEKEVPELNDVRNKYDVLIVGKDGVKTYVDVYRVMTAFNVKNAALQHANKKILKAGERGHKDYVQDLKEAIASIELAILEW